MKVRSKIIPANPERVVRVVCLASAVLIASVLSDVVRIGVPKITFK